MFYKALSENLTDEMKQFYNNYIIKYRTKYCLEYTNPQFIRKNKKDMEKIIERQLIKYNEQDISIGDKTYKVEIFENNDKNSDDKGNIIPYKTIKVLNLILNKTENLDTFAFINEIIEKSPHTVRVLVSNIIDNPQIIFENWKYKNITLQTIFDGNTFLHEFVRNNNVAGIEILRNAKCNPNVQNHFAKTPLEMAIENNDININTIEALLEFENIDIEEIMDVFGIDVTILQYLVFSSSRKDKNQIVELLLKKGADLNKKIKYTEGITLLQEACSLEDAELVEILLRYRAYVNTFSNWFKYSPLHITIKNYGKNPGAALEIINLLLKYGANINALETGRRSPLYLAIEKYDDLVENNNLKLIKLLIKKGAGVNLRHYLGKTPLYKAIEKDSYEIVKLLIENGADINVKFYGKTLLEIAHDGKNKKIIDLLEFEKFKKDKDDWQKKEKDLENIKTLEENLAKLKAEQILSETREKGLSDTINELNERIKTLEEQKELNPEQKVKLSLYQRYRKRLYAGIIGFILGGLGVFGFLKYLQYKKGVQKH